MTDSVAFRLLQRPKEDGTLETIWVCQEAPKSQYSQSVLRSVQNILGEDSVICEVEEEEVQDEDYQEDFGDDFMMRAMGFNAPQRHDAMMDQALWGDEEDEKFYGIEEIVDVADEEDLMFEEILQNWGEMEMGEGFVEGGTLDMNSTKLEEVLEQYIETSRVKSLPGVPDVEELSPKEIESIKRRAGDCEEEPFDDEAEFRRLHAPREIEMDCQSIISSRQTICSERIERNTPSCIDKPIRLTRFGVPKEAIQSMKEKYEEKNCTSASYEGESDDDDFPKINWGASRKGESMKQKKLRKQLAKERKRQAKLRKKMVKTAYKEESEEISRQSACPHPSYKVL